MSTPTFFYPAKRTPVVASDALPDGHKPLGVVRVDGVDVTREMSIYMVKLGRVFAEKLPARISREQFVREQLASANHDLLCSGYPLISEDEIISDENPLAAIVSAQRIEQLRRVVTKSHETFLAHFSEPPSVPPLTNTPE